MPKPTVSTTFNAINKMKGPMDKMGKAVRGFARGATVAIGLVSVGFGAMIREASKIEDAVAGFTPLLGGVEKANQLVEKLNQTAATTPFQFDDIAKAAKQLLPVMNQDIERTTETFRMLGDTAGGNAQKLDSITRGFTKAMLKNKVDMESLNMIAEAGVPIYTELADSLGVTVAEMMDMSRAGKISSTDLEDAFKNMTKEGGVFFKGMEIASKTLTGKLSTLKDNISLTAASLGKNLLPTIKPLIDKAIQAAGAMREWVSNNQEMINQKLQDVFRRVSNAVIKVKEELSSVFLKSDKGKTAIDSLKKAFELLGPALEVMWAIAKPILESLLTLIEPLNQLLTLISEIGKFFGGSDEKKIVWEKREAAAREQFGGAYGLRGANDAQARGQAITDKTNYSWQGYLQIAGAGAGSTFSQGGNAPPIDVDMGRRTGRL